MKKQISQRVMKFYLLCIHESSVSNENAWTTDRMPSQVDFRLQQTPPHSTEAHFCLLSKHTPFQL